jgi:hypothetical protein
MNDRKEAAPPNGGAHYREIASKLRIVARECHFPNARQEQLDIAASFNRRADHFDRPAGTCKRMAVPFGPGNSEMMREVAALWRRLADDAEARAANPLRPLGASTI